LYPHKGSHWDSLFWLQNDSFSTIETPLGTSIFATKPTIWHNGTVGSDALFGALAATISWLFALLTWNQYRSRGKSHQLLWTVGIAFFALGVTLEVIARSQGSWNEGGYRAWYFTGAMMGVTWLGQGTLHLLDKRPWVQRSTEMLIIASLVAFFVVLNAPLQLSSLELPFMPKGTAFADIKLAGWASPRAWTIPFNIYGTLWLVGGALYSSAQLWRSNRSRAWGTFFIAIAGLMLAGTSTLNRFGIAGLESLGRMVGVSVLFMGFGLTSVDPEKLLKVNLPKIPPLALFAMLGWAFALFAFFKLEPGAWNAVVDYPGLFLIAVIILGLFGLVINKARNPRVNSGSSDFQQ
jgi:hypothetical protein